MPDSIQKSKFHHEEWQKHSTLFLKCEEHKVQINTINNMFRKLYAIHDFQWYDQQNLWFNNNKIYIYKSFNYIK